MHIPAHTRGTVSLGALLALLLLPVVLWSSSVAADPAQAKVNRYIGAAKCKNCHADKATGDQHGAWMKMKHAKAFETLAGDEAKKIAKEKGLADAQKAPECLKCHVTGHGKPAAELDKGFDMKLGIQCEACHGPGEKHMKARVAAAGDEEEEEDLDGGDKQAKYTKIPADEIVVDPGMKTCLACHNSESPSFKNFCFHRANAEVRHLNPAKPRTAEELQKILACGEGEKCTCKNGDDGCKCGVPDPKVQKK
jgi:hypothetical protein